MGKGMSSSTATGFLSLKRRLPGSMPSSLVMILCWSASQQSLPHTHGLQTARTPVSLNLHATCRASTGRDAMGSGVVPHGSNEIDEQTNITKNRRRQRQPSKKKTKSANKSAAASVKGTNAPRKRRVEVLPWNAPYKVSIKTQKRIQAASSNLPSNDPILAATAVLDTLLSSSPTKCNAANVVCALTLSSKTLNQTWRGRSCATMQERAKFQSKFYDVCRILNHLVDDDKLITRQLCNAAWGIGKHVEYGDEVLLNRHRLATVSRGSSQWNLKDQYLGVGEEEDVIDHVFDSIARRMIGRLNDLIKPTETKSDRVVKTGELSMLLWSFAVAKPRDCPPGWEKPRQIERLNEENLPSQNGDVVTYVEQLEHSGSPAGVSSDNPKERSVADRLFDAAALLFCQGQGSAVLQSPSKEQPLLLQQCSWNEVSNIAWSYATRGAYNSSQGEAMVTFFAREATRRIHHCLRRVASDERECNILPRDAIQIAWALGTMDADNVSTASPVLVRLVDAMHEYWIKTPIGNRPLKSWTCADLTQMATALSHGRLDNQSVLDAVYDEALIRLEKRGGNPGRFSAREISTLMWSQARLYLTPKYGHVYDKFPSVAARALLRRIGPNSPPEVLIKAQEQANLAWSFTVLEDYRDPSVVSLLQNIFSAASSSRDIQLEHAHQLWQSYYLLSSECPTAVQNVPSEFVDYLEQKWKHEKSRVKNSSSRHRAISRTLDLMRVRHLNEYDDVDVAIALDYNSTWTHDASDFETNGERSQVKVAVEFDGPHHFTVMGSNEEDLMLLENGIKITPRVLGHTVLKYRLLKKKGWTVVRIPYYEFDKIPIWSSMERQRYLQRKLKTHSEIRFSGVDVSEYSKLPVTRHSRFD